MKGLPFRKLEGRYCADSYIRDVRWKCDAKRLAAQVEFDAEPRSDSAFLIGFV
jgi:hypothetical protein